MSTARKALISVSDKRGVAQVAARLARLGFGLLSTGGTAAALRSAGLDVTDVSDHTGFPEILGGRVKTLHPKIHGGLLARADADASVLQQHLIEPIALLVVNLYPFSQTVARPRCTLAEAVENIDIGGPAMLRAAAKNHAHVVVLVNPDDYAPVLDELEQTGAVSPATRLRLAARAFEHTARYDGAITGYLQGQLPEATPAGGNVADDGTGPGRDSGASQDSDGHLLPASLQTALVRETTLRYGENPHQRAALYRAAVSDGAGWHQHAGKPLSFNNIADTDTAWAAASELAACACVIVKHANPCGAALGESPQQAYERAWAADPTSAFGGIVAFNRPIDATVLAAVLERQFVEVVIAPAVHGEVADVMARKPNVRLLTAPDRAADATDAASAGSAAPASAPGLTDFDLRATGAGLLVQERDRLRITDEDLRVVTRRRPSNGEIAELLFAWTVAKWVKSNAIVYTRDGCTVGIGGGQTSRVDAARLGVTKARTLGFEPAGAAMASDAFFPFRDGIDEAAGHGVSTVIQPGGSMRDAEVIAAADEHGMAMVFTDHRHFRH